MAALSAILWFSAQAPAALAADGDPAAANNFNQSGNGSEGLVGVNQNAGDANNQSNIATIALTGGDNSAAVAKVIADVEQREATGGNSQTFQTNTIDGSFNNFTGIAQLNQVTGQANDQLNIVAIAFAPGATFSPALTDVELRGVTGPVSGRNQSSADADSVNTITDSFNHFQGLAQIQQVSGDSNVVVNVVTIAIGTGG
jgi:uncharacterized protein (UPF0333 family)